MSKTRLIVYSAQEFKQLSRIDRIAAEMMFPGRYHLSGADEEYKAKLEHIYHACYDMLSETEGVNWILSNYPDISDARTARTLFNDCHVLFGRFVRKNRELDRAKLIEKFYAIGEKLQKDAQPELGDMDTEKMALALQYFDKAAKLQGLYDKVEQDFDADSIKLPQVVYVTTNPAALDASNEEEAEYEE